MIELTKALEDAAATNKPKEKQAAISGLSEESQRLMYLAYNPFITFGVKKLPEYKVQPDTPGEEDLTTFFDLVDKLSNREITGTTAYTWIEQVLSSYSGSTADVLARVLKKDLRANIKTETINKVYNNLIPVHKCMLAAKMDENKFDWNSAPWLVEAKYDGMRLNIKVVGDTVLYLSREGRPQPKFEGLFDEELRIMRDAYGQDIVVDGEVLAPTFKETMKSRGKDGDQSNLILRVFDMLTLEEWDTQKSNRINSERRNTITTLLNTSVHPYLDNPKVYLSEGAYCNNKQELMQYYVDLVDAGYEGAIIKDPDSKYRWGRNRVWTKYKPIWTADLQVIGRYEGSGSNENRLGGLNLQGELEDGTVVRADVGSGFTDAERDRLWNVDFEEIEGQTVEIEYQEITQGEGKELPSLRFLTYKGFRNDK